MRTIIFCLLVAAAFAAGCGRRKGGADSEDSATITNVTPEPVEDAAVRMSEGLSTALGD